MKAKSRAFHFRTVVGAEEFFKYTVFLEFGDAVSVVAHSEECMIPFLYECERNHASLRRVFRRITQKILKHLPYDSGIYHDARKRARPMEFKCLRAFFKLLFGFRQHTFEKFDEVGGRRFVFHFARLNARYIKQVVYK